MTKNKNRFGYEQQQQQQEEVCLSKQATKSCVSNPVDEHFVECFDENKTKKAEKSKRVETYPHRIRVPFVPFSSNILCVARIYKRQR